VSKLRGNSEGDYGRLVSDISEVLEKARRTAARAVNSLLTATYWEVGRRIVEFEQGGKTRAAYGEQLLIRLGKDLTVKHGRGFSRQGVQKMRAFYLGWEICPTVSGKLEARVKCSTASGKIIRKKQQTLSAESDHPFMLTPTSLRVVPMDVFPLSWSHYVRLMAVEKPQARTFYETEAIRGGWSVRQLTRQIDTQFYERAVKSKRPQALLARGHVPLRSDAVLVAEEIRDPYLLEFLNLKDEYGENDLEEALIRHLEGFSWKWGRDSLLSPGKSESVWGLVVSY